MKGGHHLYLPNSSYPKEKNVILLIKMVTFVIDMIKSEFIFIKETSFVSLYIIILIVILIKLERRIEDFTS